MWSERKQIDPALPDRALGFQPHQFGLHGGELLVEIGLRAQAVRAGKGVDAEIADEQRGEGVKPERGQDSAAAVVGDHAVILPTRVKADLMRGPAVLSLSRQRGRA